MGAYDKNGLLKRVVEANAIKAHERAEKGEAEPEKDEAGKEDKNKDLPEETPRDRVPFPLNKYFVSQPVLSDELREEIWSRIMKDGKSVREVSAELKVEMSRVGAVVRLKEVEKEWKRIVSLPRNFLPPRRLYDDSLKNRLVFKTTTWLQNLRMRASLKFLTILLFFLVYFWEYQLILSERENHSQDHTHKPLCLCCPKPPLTQKKGKSHPTNRSTTCQSTPQLDNKSSTLHPNPDISLVQMLPRYSTRIFSPQTTEYRIRSSSSSTEKEQVMD
jgi:hypothetical protein